ncbi:hypothetical protein B7G68_04580 [Caulobacter segnis]|uniref:FG-GAP repeat protein n=2 Tax=Caulobacter segnis TaxID=88688 RepID=D5VEY0_CAUST|nr:hypothetical protein [Caulobacter segnis]ADG09398.1 FG-GAP repeat protein [Caulobacter segnis ATCC 21756]AVQ01198.1 hypothetical protein B7G68_04580 [Caulobacter segnis]
MLPLILLLATGLPASVSGDFDHDGKPDVAAVQRDGGEAYVLSIKRGGGAETPARIRLGKGFPDILTAAQAKSVEATACAKGAGPRDAPCPDKVVTVEKGDLLFGTAEASLAVAKWDGRAFRVTWISD